MSQPVNFASQMQEHLKNIETHRMSGIQDQLKKLQAMSQPVNFASQMQEHLKNAEAYRMGGIQDQLKKLQAMSQPVNFASQIQEHIKNAEAYRMGGIQDQLKKLQAMSQPVNFASQIQEHIRNIDAYRMDSIQDQLKKLHEISRPVSLASRFQEQIKSFESYRMDNIQELRSVLTSTLEFQNLAQNQAELVNNIHINGDGTFSVGNESVSQEEIIEYINDFSINYESYIDFINGFIEQLKNLRNPVIQAVLIGLFIPYFIGICVNLTTPYWQEQWDQYASLRTREVKKEIISSANENYDSQFLQGHHFVATKILYVRKYESTKAEMIDELYIGKIVKVIDKKRSWCLIEYQDSDTNELKQGWVFSRYLSKFNR